LHLHGNTVKLDPFFFGSKSVFKGLNYTVRLLNND